MRKFTSEMVNDYADKLLIGLTEEENKMVLDEFSIIDSDIDKINNIKGIENVEPMTHALDDFVYQLREDIPEESIPVSQLLANCDVCTDCEVEVPRMIGGVSNE